MADSAGAAALALQVQDLTFGLVPGAADILHQVSFALPPGARCLVIGWNGAGKSTLLELLAGRKMAPAGKVTICGADPFRGSSGSRVALVQGGWRGCSFGCSEEKAAFLRVSEILGLAGAETEMTDSPAAARRARVHRALRLEGLLDRFFGSLSDGERRRVELGRQLREFKDVVLLDEATTDLDLPARSALFSLLAEESRADPPCTLVNVTHVFDGLGDWPTHLLQLHGGRVVRFEAIPAEGPRPWDAAGGLFPAVASWLRSAGGDTLMPPQFELPRLAGTEGLSQACVDINGLAFAYAPDAETVLRLGQLQIPPGCRCVLLGLNGAGKSSLLSVLAGRRMVLEGEVRVLGFRAFHDHAQLDASMAFLSSEWKRQVGELSSGRSLTFKELANTAIQDAVARGKDMSVLAGRMLRLIQMLGIDPSKPLGMLSDGMMRRVQIALKMLEPAKLVLIDEVTADLDVLSRQALLQFLRGESEAGTSIIYCTHIFDGLDGWATHLLRLRPCAEPGILLPVAENADCKPGSLLEQVAAFLAEDTKISDARPVRQRPAPRPQEGDSELPLGWDKRGSSASGAYGNYSWNAETGSAENWTYGSAGLASPDSDQVKAQSGPGGFQSGMMGGSVGMPSGMPGMHGGMAGGTPGMHGGMPGGMPGGMAGGFGGGMPGMMGGQPGMMGGQPGMMGGMPGMMGGAPGQMGGMPGMMGGMPGMAGGMTGMPAYGQQGGMPAAGMPAPAAGAGYDAAAPAPKPRQGDSCPDWFSSRSNATPLDELVRQGVVQPEKVPQS
eukprot:TRINITY_DN19451_c0_g4_i1.p1 TRINITY_DN19451_c0_g4~~TRINITY_DN19451_c0_g4_i1.p1  ORF type:complete len:803 (+),score=190.18 TRINITY_DN19451_c0_g4_i1:63-2411(+)